MKFWKHHSKRGLALFLALMMCVSLFPTAAFAAEDEHVHGDDCVKVLTCALDEHEHDEECYVSQEPLCGETGHKHVEECYDENGELVCVLEEYEHEHDETCYVSEEPLCGREEHQHDDGCYTWECPEDEDNQESGGIQETQKPEIPAEVQEFLNAVAGLPDNIVTPEEYDAVEAAMQDILSLYQTFDEADYECEGVDEALMKLETLQNQLGQGRPKGAVNTVSKGDTTVDAPACSGKIPYTLNYADNYGPTASAYAPYDARSYHQPDGRVTLWGNQVKQDVIHSHYMLGQNAIWTMSEFEDVRYGTTSGSSQVAKITYSVETYHDTCCNRDVPCLVLYFAPGTVAGTAVYKVQYWVMEATVVEGGIGVSLGETYSVSKQHTLYYTVTNYGDGEAAALDLNKSVVSVNDEAYTGQNVQNGDTVMYRIEARNTGISDSGSGNTGNVPAAPNGKNVTKNPPVYIYCADVNHYLKDDIGYLGVSSGSDGGLFYQLDSDGYTVGPVLPYNGENPYITGNYSYYCTVTLNEDAWVDLINYAYDDLSHHYSKWNSPESVDMYWNGSSWSASSRGGLNLYLTCDRSAVSYPSGGSGSGGSLTSGDLNNVVITDKLSTYLTTADAPWYNASAGSVALGGDGKTVTWNVGDLEANDNATLEITTKVTGNPAGGTKIVNSVTAKVDGETPGLAPDSNPSAEIEVGALTISKMASKTEVTAGEEFTYTIAVKNETGQTIPSLTVSEPIDTAHLELVRSSVNPGNQGNQYDSSTGLWTINNLENDATTTLTLTVKAKATTQQVTVGNTAQITKIGETDVTDGPTGSVNVTVNPKLTTYKIVHEYYTNNTLDGSTEQIIKKDVYVGNTVRAEDITRVYTYTKANVTNTYGFTSATPDSITLDADADQNVITLRYDRASYTVQWLDADNGGAELKRETRIDAVGAAVSVEETDKAYTGYTFDSDNAGNKLTDTLAKTGTVLKMYFKKAATTVTVEKKFEGITKEQAENLQVFSIEYYFDGNTVWDTSLKRLAKDNAVKSEDGLTWTWEVSVPAGSKLTSLKERVQTLDGYTLNVTSAFDIPETSGGIGGTGTDYSLRSNYSARSTSTSDTSTAEGVLPGKKVTDIAVPDGAVKATITNSYTTKPDKPDKEDLQQVGIWVRCGDNEAHSGGEDWWKLGGEQTSSGALVEWNTKWRTIGEVQGDAENGYTCVVTVPAQPWADLRIDSIKKSGVTIQHVLDVTRTGGESIEVPFKYVDGKWTTDTEMVTIWLKELPELTITKSAPKGVKAGGDVEYTITVANNTNVDATNVVVTDRLPEQLAGYIKTSSPNYNLNEGVYSWNLGTIEAGDFKEIKFTAPAGSGVTGSAKNTAYVTCDGVTDPVPSNEVETKLFKLTPTKGHEEKITLGNGTATIKYTVTIKNESGFDLYGLDIIDTLQKPVITSGTASLKLKPTSLATTDGTVEVEALEEEFDLSLTEDTTHIFNALDRGTVFADGSTVTLTYDVIVTNTGKDQLVLRVNNVAKGGCWTTDGTEAQMFRMMARSGGGYDAESEEVGDKAGVGDEATVVIPPAQTAHTVTFNSNGGGWNDGDTTKSATTDENNKVTAPENPEQAKKVFDGWYTEPTGGEKVDLTTKTFTEDTTLYAHWDDDALIDPNVPEDQRPEGGGDGIPDKYQVEVKFTSKKDTATFTGDTTTVVTLYKGGEYATAAEGGTGYLTAGQIPTASVKDSTTHGDPAVWTAETPATTTPITGNVTFNVEFTPKNASVTYPEFKDEDKDGEPDKLPEETTDPIEAGVEIIVDPNGGTWNPTDTSKWTPDGKTFHRTAEAGEQIVLMPDPTKPDSVFMGWKKTVSPDGKTITFTAQWEDDKLTDPSKDQNGDKPGDGIPDSWQYTVTYTAEGGTVNGKVTDTVVVTKLDDDGNPSADGTATLAGHLPAAEPNKGYGNGQWKEPNGEPTADTVIAENTTFTIVYTQFTVAVKDTNGPDKGTWKDDPASDKTLKPDGEGKVTLPGKDDITPPSGKELDKWQDLDGNQYNPGEEIEPNKNLTLVPVWKDIVPDVVTVSAASVTATYDGQSHPITSVTFTRNGESVTPDSVNITYSTPTGAAPVNAGTYTAAITAKVNGQTVTGTARVTISQRTLTVRTGSSSRTYNGSALTNSSITITGQASGETITGRTTGSQTAVGSSANGYTLTWGAGVLSSNYRINAILGTLTVTRSTSGGNNGGSTGGGSTGGGGGSRPAGSSVRPSGSGTTTIGEVDVPLAGDLQLNKQDHFAYIKGYQDGTVRPNNPITRAQVATIFYRLLDDTSRAIYFADTNEFPDVTSDYWANKAISTLTNAGIITGFSDGTFRPNANITRAQFAAIAARFDNVVPGLANPFTDVAEDYWARDLIAYAADRGWITGQGGKFRPMENITRVEVMDFINNVLERHVDAQGILENATTWSDVPVSDPNYYVVEEATNSHDYERRTDGQLMENWTALNPDPVWDE